MSNAFLILDIETGAIDGYYPDIENAKDAAESWHKRLGRGGVIVVQVVHGKCERLGSEALLCERHADTR